MTQLIIDIHAIDALLSEIRETLGKQVTPGSERDNGDPPPARSLNHLRDLIDRLETTDAKGLDAQELSELGDYAQQLLGYLVSQASPLGLVDRLASLYRALASLSVWLARKGARFSDLEPVTNAFAALANQLHDTESLSRLCGLMGEVVDAAHPFIRQDQDRSNPGRPWRVLNLNRAIVATRSHDPALMDQVFRDLVSNLPEDAAGFFAEGMGQMEALNYPDPVRAVMQQYYNEWCNKTLH